MASQVPWDNVRQWLESLNLGQYADAFEYHEVTGAELPYIQEYQLEEMGVTSVGDRLRIIGETKNFLRALRNENRNKLIMRFKNWYPIHLCGIFEVSYEVTESAITVTDPDPFCCVQLLDSVDITSITDIHMQEDCFFSRVKVSTKDPSYQEKGGEIVMRLRHRRAAQVHATLKNLWEEDQLRLGRKGAAKGDALY